jgi:hypothetical protein
LIPHRGSVLIEDAEENVSTQEGGINRGLENRAA